MGEQVGVAAALARRLYAGVPGFRGWVARHRPAVCPFEELLAALPPNGRVLDVGCGNGLLLALAASTGRCREGVGVDVAGGAVAVARAAAAANGLAGLTFEQRRADEALPAGGFDAVTLVDVLHHVAPREREATVRAAAGCVAPGGVLVVKEMARRPRWRAFANWCHDLLLARQWIRHADLEAVDAWAAGSGLVMEHAAPIHRLWYAHALRVYGRPPRAQAVPASVPGSPPGPPAWLSLLRPRQWPKNLLVLAALLFSGLWGTPAAIGFALLALVAFVLASGAVYAWNDAADADIDRRHPAKRHRPVAAGRLGPGAARAIAGAAAAGAQGLAAWLPWSFAALLGVFLFLNAGYSAGAKAVPWLDVGLVASGFVLRAAAGAAAIGVVASPWLLACTGGLALFLAVAKRRQELVALGAGHRPALAGYTVAACDRLMALAVLATLVAYAWYGLAVQGPRFLWTWPLVLAGLARALWLVRTSDAPPDEALLADVPLWALVAAWVAACAALA